MDATIATPPALPPPLPSSGLLTSEQEILVLRYLISKVVKAEIATFRTKPSLALLADTPFLEYVFETLVVRFPWLANKPDEFWFKLERLTTLTHEMNISKAEVRGQETRMDRMVQRIERIIVIFFKNVLRATHTPIKAKQIDFAKIKAQVDAEAAAAAADASTSSSSPSISSLSSTDDWSASITAARDIIENGKPLTTFVIEITSNNEIVSRVLQRYQNFVDLHGTLRSKYPKVALPALPGKHRLRTQDAEFKERRRRELNRYLQLLVHCHPDVRSSPELHSFLYDNQVEKTAAEDELDRKRAQIAEDAQRHYDEAMDLVRQFFLGHRENNSIDTLYPLIKTTPNMADLPDNIKHLIHYGQLIAAHQLFIYLHADVDSEKNLGSLKRMYTLMPFTPIKAVLRLANPVKLLKGVADIFLTKMLGKNLAQRMIAEVYIKDPAMTEQGIKELRNAIRNKQVCDRIAQYVSHPDTELPSADSDKSAVLAMVLCDPRFEPPLQAQSILRSLDDAQIHSLHTLLLAEIRQADMRKLVEFYGNDEVIAILKELVSVFYVPLVELYQTADLPSLISDVKDILSSILTVAEQRTTDPKELIAQYVESLKGATERLYRFFHTAASNDSGTMEGLMSWFLSLVELARRDTRTPHAIPISEVVSGASAEQWEAIMQDAESLEEWQQQRIERYQRRIQYLLSQGIEVNEPVGLDEYISEDDLEDINDLGNFESVPELDTVIEPPPIEPPCPAIDSFLPQFNALVHERLFSKQSDHLARRLATSPPPSTATDA